MTVFAAIAVLLGVLFTPDAIAEARPSHGNVAVAHQGAGVARDLAQKLQEAEAAQPGRHICYAAHVQDIGWQPAVCDGAIAGTTGRSLRLEAISIRGTELGPVCYGLWIQGLSWKTGCDERVVGTTGLSLRSEGFYVSTVYGVACYQVHMQDLGWLGQVCNGKHTGTPGQGRRLEAVQIRAS
jgi:uncharacterized protein YjdB